MKWWVAVLGQKIFTRLLNIVHFFSREPKFGQPWTAEIRTQSTDWMDFTCAGEERGANFSPTLTWASSGLFRKRSSRWRWQPPDAGAGCRSMSGSVGCEPGTSGTSCWPQAWPVQQLTLKLSCFGLENCDNAVIFLLVNKKFQFWPLASFTFER